MKITFPLKRRIWSLLILSGAYPILGPSFMLDILTISICVHAIVSSRSEAISGFEPAAVTFEFQARVRVRVSEIMKLASVIGPFHPTTFLPVCVIRDLPLKANRNFKNKLSRLRTHSNFGFHLSPFTHSMSWYSTSLICRASFHIQINTPCGQRYFRCDHVSALVRILSLANNYRGLMNAWHKIYGIWCSFIWDSIELLNSCTAHRMIQISGRGNEVYIVTCCSGWLEMWNSWILRKAIAIHLYMIVQEML